MESKEYWNQRYSQGGNSGYGSYGDQLEKKLKWLDGLPINSITEVGCGDFNFGQNLTALYPQATYWGCDISSVIITQNKEKYPQYNFCSMSEPIPQADLVMCIDVLFHTLTDEDYNRTLEALDKLTTKYLAVTAYEYDQEQGLAPHVRIRKFDPSRFGKVITREVVEEDGQLYFYLIKRSEIKLQEVTAVLNTKDPVYPREVLESVAKYPFGEILIKTGSDSPHRKYEMFEKAKYDTIYYQDDDAVVDIDKLIRNYDPDLINVGMKQSHFDSYSKLRMTMGLGWGCFFNKSVLKELKNYTDRYGEDEVFKRDTEKLLTHLVFPQNRVVLNVRDLPSSMAPDRLSLEPHHYDNMQIIMDRCKDLI